MFVIKNEKGEMMGIPTKGIKTFSSSPLAMKIMETLAKEPLYPRALAKRLDENEQKIYYHVRNLQTHNLVEVMPMVEMDHTIRQIDYLRILSVVEISFGMKLVQDFDGVFHPQLIANKERIKHA